MGLLWSFVTPLLMLLVYTFVFSVIFKSRWTQGTEETKAQFALILFAGLCVHSLFAETLSRAPTLIVGNANLVKKVVFPLEVLPAVALCTALFQFGISMLVLLLMALSTGMAINLNFLFVPIVMFPLLLLTQGFAWALASLGVFFRDLAQAISIAMSVMLFFAPVFFPTSAMPKNYQHLIMLNPVSFIIEQIREVLIWGRHPDWLGLLIYFCVASSIFWLGHAWFQKTRKGFADVL